METQVKAIADHALLVSFAEDISDDAHALVVALDKALADQPPEGHDRNRACAGQYTD